MEIEVIKGETGQSCGVACLRSVFKFYDKDLSEEDIWKHNETKNGINWIYDLGYAAIKLGFKAKIIDFNYFIFKEGDNDLKGKKFMGSAKDAAESALKFLDNSGEIEVKIFTLKDVKRYIGEGTPVIMRVRPKIYAGQGDPNGLHYIIVEGYTGDKFKIVDPMGTKREISAEILLYSAYSSFAQILIIKN